MSFGQPVMFLRVAASQAPTHPPLKGTMLLDENGVLWSPAIGGGWNMTSQTPQVDAVTVIVPGATQYTLEV